MNFISQMILVFLINRIQCCVFWKCSFSLLSKVLARLDIVMMEIAKLSGMEIVGSKSIEFDGIKIQSRSISDPPLSDIDFKNKMTLASTTFN